jgi:hypothetical protein
MTLGVVHHSPWFIFVPSAVILIIGLVFLVPAYRRSKRNSVDLDVVVGETELHTVKYIRNAWTGRVRIAVDGAPLQSRIEWISWKMEKRYEFRVGESEHHVVTFVKTRKKLFPGIRKQTVVAYVDGNEADTG